MCSQMAHASYILVKRSDRTVDSRQGAPDAQGLAEFSDLAAVPTFREFVSLYIAEGYKRNRNRASICNSDPNVMRMSVRWLRHLSDKSMGFSIQYHADQDLEALRAFWAITLSIPADSIRLQRKSNSGQLEKRTWRSVHGVLNAVLNDTLLRARMQAWMDRLREEWE
jgi:hypothetical protein